MNKNINNQMNRRYFIKTAALAGGQEVAGIGHGIYLLDLEKPELAASAAAPVK